MQILFLYDTNDLGLFPESRVGVGIQTPILREYSFAAVEVNKIPRAKRSQTIRESIDEAEVLAIVIGSFTFQRLWAREAILYGFTRTKPMMGIDQSNLNDGWSTEITTGPPPFDYLKWTMQGKWLTLSELDPYLDTIWTQRLTLPRASVHYKLETPSGQLSDIFLTHDWVLDDVNRNFPQWVETAMYDAGKG